MRYFAIILFGLIVHFGASQYRNIDFTLAFVYFAMFQLNRCVGQFRDLINIWRRITRRKWWVVNKDSDYIMIILLVVLYLTGYWWIGDVNRYFYVVHWCLCRNYYGIPVSGLTLVSTLPLGTWLRGEGSTLWYIGVHTIKNGRNTVEKLHMSGATVIL